MKQQDFGSVLRMLRHERGQTLEQVSEATGLSAAMLSRIERGERLPSSDSVEALAKYFGLPVDQLMSETIAHRMLGRYNAKTIDLAARRMRTMPEDDLLELCEQPVRRGGEGARQPEDPSPSPGSPVSEKPSVRTYGAFEQRPIDEALAPNRWDLASAAVGEVSARLVRPRRLFVGDVGLDGSAGLDPATERVLDAARESIEAAAMLALREAEALPRDARLDLLARVAALAERPAKVLRALADDDPDKGVRKAAKEWLNRLAKGSS